jgi:hypothetical protein
MHTASGRTTLQRQVKEGESKRREVRNDTAAAWQGVQMWHSYVQDLDAQRSQKLVAA